MKCFKKLFNKLRSYFKNSKKRKGHGENHQVVEKQQLSFSERDRLGGGSFGHVYRALDTKTGKHMAVKIIDLESAREDLHEFTRREVLLLSQCSSEYITKYYGSYLVGCKLWIIMEYVGGGSVFGIMKAGRLNEAQIAIVLRGTLKALVYLHRNRIVHRDIKAENVLVSEFGHVKLADFGLAYQLTSATDKLNTCAGTLHWAAPEVLSGMPHDIKVDIWSLGITAIEMAKRKPPYINFHEDQVLLKITRNDPPQLSGKFSAKLRSFVSACLVKSVENRPTAEELLKHPFVCKVKKSHCLVETIERYKKWQQANTKLINFHVKDLVLAKSTSHIQTGGTEWSLISKQTVLCRKDNRTEPGKPGSFKKWNSLTFPIASTSKTKYNLKLRFSNLF